MNYIRLARALGGVIAIVALMSMLIIELLFADASLEWRVVVLVVAMIGALLGVDMFKEVSTNAK